MMQKIKTEKKHLLKNRLTPIITHSENVTPKANRYRSILKRVSTQTPPLFLFLFLVSGLISACSSSSAIKKPHLHPAVQQRNPHSFLENTLEPTKVRVRHTLDFNTWRQRLIGYEAAHRRHARIKEQLMLAHLWFGNTPLAFYQLHEMIALSHAPKLRWLFIYALLEGIRGNIMGVLHWTKKVKKMVFEHQIKNNSNEKQSSLSLFDRFLERLVQKKHIVQKDEKIALFLHALILESVFLYAFKSKPFETRFNSHLGNTEKQVIWKELVKKNPTIRRMRIVGFLIAALVTRDLAETKKWLQSLLALGQSDWTNREIHFFQLVYTSLSDSSPKRIQKQTAALSNAIKAEAIPLHPLLGLLAWHLQQSNPTKSTHLLNKAFRYASMDPDLLTFRLSHAKKQGKETALALLSKLILVREYDIRLYDYLLSLLPKKQKKTNEWCNTSMNASDETCTPLMQAWHTKRDRIYAIRQSQSDRIQWYKAIFRPWNRYVPNLSLLTLLLLHDYL